MLDRLVSILPKESLRTAAKAWVAWLGTVVGLVVIVVPDSPRWLTVAIGVLTALGVYAVPNRPVDTDTH